jgi:8-oxo-dGTP pyrophosphatase MutT (NUDIX family)
MSTNDVRDDELPRGAGTAGEVAALPAASVLVVRDDPFEVLMLRRHEKSSFVPNAWVFPGGIAEQLDFEVAEDLGSRNTLSAMRVCGARETFEETGVWLGAPLDGAAPKRRRLLAGSITFRHLVHEAPIDLQRLVWTSRWITPVGIPKRFDTYFFIATTGRDVVATAENDEAVDVVWIAPSEALSRHGDGRMQMVFPTVKNLEAIAGFRDSASLIASREGAEIAPIQPVLVVEGGQKKLVIP